MDQKKIGRFLAQSRRDAALTQAQLAETLGVSDRSVSRWENGVTMPDVSLFVPLCQALHITLDEFFSGERQSQTPQAQVSARHMEGYARYLSRRTRRRTAVLAALLAMVLVLAAVLAVLCTDRTFFTGRCESEMLSGVTIPTPRRCLYRGIGGMDEFTVKLKTLRQPDELDVWIRSYLSTLEAIPTPGGPWGDAVWYDAAQNITILQYRANNDGLGFVNTVYITYRAGHIPGA
ncbi:MAG: helix-turn-helix transcriptional regulator [Ruminococcaceae bacterium]|nr:helix-turn-helix transcriptional regulator [Oscillospiraceae bacterium]